MTCWRHSRPLPIHCRSATSSPVSGDLGRWSQLQGRVRTLSEQPTDRVDRWLREDHLRSAMALRTPIGIDVPGRTVTAPATCRHRRFPASTPTQPNARPFASANSVWIGFTSTPVTSAQRASPNRSPPMPQHRSATACPAGKRCALSRAIHWSVACSKPLTREEHAVGRLEFRRGAATQFTLLQHQMRALRRSAPGAADGRERPTVGTDAWQPREPRRGVGADQPAIVFETFLHGPCIVASSGVAGHRDLP